ncbi:MAG: DNA processing protein DprA [Nitrosopumilales archaeon CG15_BIG_FIL_POST_REV_8_21_14_020_33_23]|nr:MAG: DNA processing protein DprA [Nitrosopumilales archaeon CG15_BIG_FIL_POST_REV_8_21_14_020_33_23]PIY90438.1 MAG: DNA processing protein DprA [Nitrosopumilales archaeon CG_4_10_14_0_8_um_filter_34_8]PJB98403.1 MAG: DNA processing protein DprA [Nitrosopumilales archaeon CG_4_9_14_0_8_um_filter_34_10]
MATETEYPSIDLRNLLGRPLNDIEEKYAPEIIYYKGVMQKPLPCARVSIIGTRQPSKEGILAAEEVSKILIENQVVIVSGLAKGIDTVAHETAIKNGGKTIAVIGTPLNKTYPKENTKLQEELMKNHLVISQYPIDHKTTPKDFVLRNRTMALISDASVIVEAGESSGSLYQGWETLRLGRPLFICKSVVHNPKLKWPKEMIEYGAIELDDPADILEILPSNVKMPELFQ